MTNPVGEQPLFPQGPSLPSDIKKKQDELISELAKLSLGLEQANVRQEQGASHEMERASLPQKADDGQGENLAYQEAIEKIIAQLDELKITSPAHKEKSKRQREEPLSVKAPPELASELIRQAPLKGDVELGMKEHSKSLLVRHAHSMVLPGGVVQTKAAELMGKARSITSNQLGHIHGDAFLKGTGLEGIFVDESISLMKRMIEGYLMEYGAQDKALKSVASLLDRVINTKMSSSPTNLHDEIQEKIRSLHEGESVVMAGGWHGKETKSDPLNSKHTVYYEITKRADSSFSVRIFNTGMGIQYHPRLIENSQEKYIPFLEKVGVSEEDLLDDTFVKGLWAINRGTTQSVFTRKSPIKYTAEDVYQGLFSILDGQWAAQTTVDAAIADEQRYIIPQQSGTCSWTVLMAFVQTKLPRPEFLHFQYYVGCQSLVVFCNDFELFLSGKESEKDRRLLLLVSEKFARDCTEAYEQGAISEEEFERGLATVQDIKDRLHDVQKTLFLRRYNDIPDLNIARQQKTVPFCQVRPFRSQQVSADTMPYDVYALGEERLWDFSKPLSGSILTLGLKTLYQQCRDFQSDNPLVAILLIDKMFDQLPIPEEKGDLWSSIPSQDICNCMEQITKLTELRVRLCAQLNYKEELSARTEAVFRSFKAMAIQHRLLGLSGTIPDLDDYSINVDYFRNVFRQLPVRKHILDEIQIFLCCLLSPSHNDQLAKLYDYFSSKGGPWEVAFAGAEPDVSTGKEKGWEHICKSFVKNNPKLIEHLTSKELEEYSLPLLLSNPERFSNPPNPFVLWYRQGLAAGYLAEVCPRELPSACIRDTKCPFEFSIKKKEGFGWSVSPFQAEGNKRNLKFPSTTGIGGALQTVFSVFLDRCGIFDQHTISSQRWRTDLQASLHNLPHFVELQELFALFTAEANELRLSKLLAFFTKYPDLLKEPQFQEFFVLNVASPCLLRDSFSLSKDFVSGFQRFVKVGLEAATFENDFPRRWFYMRIARYGLETIQLLHMDTPEDTALAPPLEAILEKSNNVLEKALAYRELANRIVRMASPLSEESVLNLIKARSFLSCHPIPYLYQNSQNSEIERKIVGFAPEMARFMRDPSHKEVLGSFINTLGIDDKSTEPWDFTSSFLRCQRGTQIIDLLTGSFVSQGHRLQLLPLSVLYNPEFTAVFPSGDYSAVSSHRGTVFTFNDTTGEARIILIGNELRVQRNMSGQWYEFVPEDRLREDFFDSRNPLLGSLQLVESTSFWVATDSSQILLLDKGTKIPKYKITLRENTHVESIERISDGYVLANNFYAKDSPYRFLEAIEDKAYIHVWQKDEMTSQIELPRYGLALTIGEHQGVARAFLDHPTGFYIADQQRLRGLGTFDDFLIIENAQGSRKILMPRREVLRTHPLSTEIAMNHRPTSTSKDASSFLLYEIDAEGRPETSSREENLYLAYLLLGQKNYEKSVERIRKYSGDIKRYSPQEEELFLWIKRLAEQGRDNNPPAYAVHLCAAACLLKNSRQFGGDTAIQFREFITYQYVRYLEGIGHATTAKLNEDEEKELLRYLKSPIAMFVQREQLISGHLQFREFSTTVHERSQSDPEIPRISESSLDFSLINVLRPGESIEKGFLDYYARAKNKDPSLLSEIKLARNDPDVDGELLRLLSCVAQEPDLFPSVDAAKEIIKCGLSGGFEGAFDWQEKFVNKAREVSPRLPQEASINPTCIQTVSMPIPRSPIPTIDLQPLHVPKVRALTTAEDARKRPLAWHFNVLTKKQFDRFFHREETLVSMEVDQEVDSLIEGLSPPAQSPHGRECTKIQNDIQVAFLPALQRYSLHEETVLQNMLRLEHAEVQKILYLQETALLEKANALPSEEPLALRRKMELVSTEKDPVTMRDLVIFFVQQDPAILLEKNPFLSKEQLDTVNNDLLAFFVTSTQRQQMERAQKIIAELSSPATSEKQKAMLVNDLAAELDRKRVYDPGLHPEYLVYESRANILIRSDQVAILEKMGREGAPETVYQVIMGSGKSKVLLPILALKKATGHNLSIIIVPEPLAEEEARDMQILVGQSFYQSTTVISLDRHSDFSTMKMKELYEDLERIRSRKGCLVMTSKTPGCLLLQFETEVRNYVKEDSKGPIPENLEWMRKTLLLLKERGDVILDEADVLLDSRKELNFSLGEPTALPAERLDCIELLFEALFEVLPKGAETALDPSNFDASFRRKIAEKLLDTIEKRGGDIADCLRRTGLKKEQILSYITGTASPQVAATATNCAEQVRDLLDLMKGELTQLLPLTLGKACDTGYGFSKATSKAIAIPYDSNNSPVEVSDFGSTYEILNYTVQSYLNKRPLPPHIIRPIITKIQNQLREEKREYPSTLFSSLPSYTKLQELMGKEDFHPFDETLYEQIITQLSDKNQVQRLLNFARTYVLSQVSFHPEKITLTAPGLVDMFHHVQGFTGTPWNSATYPARLTSEEARGTDGTTLRLLWKNSRTAIHELRGEGFATAFDEIIALIKKGENYQAFIDAGALFRGSDNETVARCLLKSLSDCKGVVFYRGDKMMMLESCRVEAIPFEDSVLEPSERFTYYDQRHTTGSDIHQSAQATALVSIGKDLALRGFVQGVWRMRGLAAEQRVEIVVPPSAKKKILEVCGGTKIQDISPIIRTMAEVQFAKLDDHCLLAAMQKADQVLKRKVLDELIRAPELNHDRVMTEAAKLELLVSNTEDHPHLAFGSKGKYITREEFQRNLLDRQQRWIKKAWKQPEDQISIAQSLEKTIEECPIQEKGILSSSTVETAEVETEREKELEQEVEQLLQVEMQPERGELDKMHGENYLFEAQRGIPVDPSEQFRTPLLENSNPLRARDSINGILTKQGIALSEPLFDEGICVSGNFCGFGLPQLVPQLFFQNQYPVQHLLVAKLAGRTEARFLTFSEAQWFLTELKNGSKGNQPIFLYDMDIGLIQHAGDEQEVSDILKSDEFLLLKVQAKVFNGECTFSKEELPYVRQWLQGKDKRAVIDFFVNRILFHKPAQRLKFAKSILAKVLTE